MDSYYDRLNDFFRRAESEQLPAAQQLVMLHLLHINNRAGNLGHFTCTDERLIQLTGLKKFAITQAKRALKNRGLIDFTTSKAAPRTGTHYLIPALKKTDTTARISTAVEAAWVAANGQPLKGAVASALAALEAAATPEALVDAINEASLANSRERLSFNFVKAVIDSRAKGGGAGGRSNSNLGRFDQYDAFADEQIDARYDHDTH